MLFFYKAVNKEGKETEGSIEAQSKDQAINALQRRELIIVDIAAAGKASIFERKINLFSRVSMKDIVILSRQLATLIGAGVPVLAIFRLIASDTENEALQDKLADIIDDIQAGVSISQAMSKHPKVFSPFYVNMIKAAEESGKLPETFGYLADYTERSYQLINRARNALVYPIFVIVVFIVVMILMLVLVIPQLTSILVDSGQAIPVFTRLIIGVSDFFISYGIILVIFIAIMGVVLWRHAQSEAGRLSADRFKLSIPYIGSLYEKIYLTRIADSLHMLLESGIPMIRSIEITADVVGSEVYRNVLLESAEAIKSGSSVSETFSRYPEMPKILTQMTRIGEETGKLGYILKTVSRFYSQEVKSNIDLLVSLIEPILIVVLGLGVALLLSGILLPIYSLTGAI